MTNLRRSPVLIVAVLTLLAVRGGTVSAATPARTAAALVKGEFAGNAGHLAGIGLSTNGRRVIAYLCNGTSRHISLAQWFHGPVTRNRIDITNAAGTHLVATASAHVIKGTVKLKDGRSAHFTARLIPHPGRNYGLFRSAETFKGVHYLGGWILVPKRAGVPAGTGTGASPASVMVPYPTCCTPQDRGGIINERTGALIKSPAFNGHSVTVPRLGRFRLTACRVARC